MIGLDGFVTTKYLRSLHGNCRRLYFGRQICSTDRSFLNEFALSKRKYIGPTSMDHEMAFLMCNMVRRGEKRTFGQSAGGLRVPYSYLNRLHLTSPSHLRNQGKVRRGSLVMDPFVGTGSILVSAAHRGAVTLGMDIDIRVSR